MSDFRERYNHYMEMYKLSPPSVMDRRVSWAGGGPVLCNYDHHRRHRGGTGSVELCSQVDNLLHQVHNAQQMLNQSSLYSVNANYQANNNYRHNSMNNNKQGYYIATASYSGHGHSPQINNVKKPPHLPVHVSGQSDSEQDVMSSEFKKTLERWRSSKRQTKHGSHKEKNKANSFHHHIALNWDNLYFSSGHDPSDPTSELKNKYYHKMQSEYDKGIYLYLPLLQCLNFFLSGELKCVTQWTLVCCIFVIYLEI